MLNTEVEEYGRLMREPGSELLRGIRVKRVAEQAVTALDEVATKTIHSI
jgi:histone H3/H4